MYTMIFIIQMVFSHTLIEQYDTQEECLEELQEWVELTQEENITILKAVCEER